MRDQIGIVPAKNKYKRLRNRLINIIPDSVSVKQYFDKAGRKKLKLDD